MAVRIRVLLALAASVLFPVAAMADLQKAKDDLAVTQPGHSVWINVLANDGDLGPGLRLLKAFKPAHGSAAIENGGIRYTPAAGFQGSDSFRYMAQPAKSQPGEATVDVEVGHGGVALTLKGRVVDAPLPGALVTATINGFEFRAVADANGNYSLDIAALRGDAFVTLVATGSTPAGISARFVSVVGEIARLSAAAGVDGILVRDENNQVQVTNLSTAQYSLLAEANGGTPVGNDQQLLPLVQNIDLDRLLELAAVIKLVVDGGVPLPPGTTDVLSLISSESAVASFEAGLAPDQLDMAIDAVAQDAQLTPIYQAGAIPSGYALIPPSAPGTIQPFAGVARVLHFNNSASGSSGTGTDLDLSFDSAPGTSWILQGGDIVVTEAVPFTVDADVLLLDAACDARDYAFAHETLLRQRLHRVQDGVGVDYVEVTSTYHRVFPPGESDYDPDDNCNPPADGDFDVAVMRLAFEDGAGELPFAPAESFDSIGLAHWVGSQHRWGAGLYHFAPPTVPVGGVTETFSWQIASGRLLVHLDGSNIDTEYRRYQSDGRLGEGLLAVATLPDGRQAASYNLAARNNPQGFFNDSIMPGNWRSGVDIAQFNADDPEHFGFSVILAGDHTGYQHFVDADGTVDDHVKIAWSTNAGYFVAKGYFDVNGPPGQRHRSSCISVDPNQCWQFRQRDWTPIARDGNRVYVVERVSFAFDGPGPLVTSEGGERVNFWELQ